MLGDGCTQCNKHASVPALPLLLHAYLQEANCFVCSRRCIAVCLVPEATSSLMKFLQMPVRTTEPPCAMMSSRWVQASP